MGRVKFRFIARTCILFGYDRTKNCVIQLNPNLLVSVCFTFELFPLHNCTDALPLRFTKKIKKQWTFCQFGVLLFLTIWRTFVSIFCQKPFSLSLFLITRKRKKNGSYHEKMYNTPYSNGEIFSCNCKKHPIIFNLILMLF